MQARAGQHILTQRKLTPTSTPQGLSALQPNVQDFLIPGAPPRRPHLSHPRGLKCFQKVNAQRRGHLSL